VWDEHLSRRVELAALPGVFAGSTDAPGSLAISVRYPAALAAA